MNTLSSAAAVILAIRSASERVTTAFFWSSAFTQSRAKLLLPFETVVFSLSLAGFLGYWIVADDKECNRRDRIKLKLSTMTTSKHKVVIPALTILRWKRLALTTAAIERNSSCSCRWEVVVVYWMNDTWAGHRGTLNIPHHRSCIFCFHKESV